MLKKLIINEKVRNVVFAYGAALISVCSIVTFLAIFAPDYLPKVTKSNQLNLFGLVQILVSSCVIAPLWEELLFRYAPIEFTRHLINDSQFNKIKWPLIVIIGLVFGWIHGGVFNVFVQGTCGIFLTWVYIKNGFSYWSSVALHAIWNFMAAVGLPVLFSI